MNVYLTKAPYYDEERRLIILNVVDDKKSHAVIEITQGRDRPLLQLEVGQAVRIGDEVSNES